MKKTNINDNVIRVDAYEKARGEALYLTDINFPNQLYARMIRSPKSRGIIKDVKIPKLEKDYYYIDHNDLIGKNSLKMIFEDWKCFAGNEVNYIGETIGLLVGPSLDRLYEIEEEIEINIEEQDAIFTIDDAIAKKTIIHEPDNIYYTVTADKGCVNDEVFDSAYEVFEETVETGFQEHVHLETNAVACTIEDGKITVYASSQCPFYVRKSVAGLIGLDVEDLVVKQVTTGGAFGGKENFTDILAGPLVVAVNKIKRPIKLVFDREEDMLYSVKRHPSKVTFKTALDEKGNILAIDAVIYYNAGYYMSSSLVVLQRGVFHANGVYDIPNMVARGYLARTNTFPSDAFRGFGAPQTIFAIELHLNHIAKKYGYDPASYKQKYFMKKDSVTITEGHIVEDVMLDKMLDQIATASNYYDKFASYQKGKGKGIGISFYNLT